VEIRRRLSRLKSFVGDRQDFIFDKTIYSRNVTLSLLNCEKLVPDLMTSVMGTLYSFAM